MSESDGRRVLFIQHAATAGGSALSLLYTAGLLRKRGFEVFVALVTPDPWQTSALRKEGVEVVSAEGVAVLAHTTLGWHRVGDLPAWIRAGREMTRAFTTRRVVERLLREIRPSVVHLNSVVLLPAAAVLHRLRVPFVWHVRESTVRGYFGIRTAFMKRALRRWPSEVVFLSEAERRLWGCEGRGQVMPNFVPAPDFLKRDRDAARRQFGLDDGSFTLLYVGGPPKIKGIFVLIESIRRLVDRGVPVVCLMPGSAYTPTQNATSRLARRLLPALGSGTPGQLVEEAMREAGVEAQCRRLPFDPDIAPYLSACDVLVSPATENHFARPIVEASLASRPVVASRLATLSEMVENEETGLLFEAGNAGELADALERLWRSEDLRKSLAAAALTRALERYDAERYLDRLVGIYARVTGA